MQRNVPESSASIVQEGCLNFWERLHKSTLHSEQYLSSNGRSNRVKNLTREGYQICPASRDAFGRCVGLLPLKAFKQATHYNMDLIVSNSEYMHSPMMICLRSAYTLNRVLEETSGRRRSKARSCLKRQDRSTPRFAIVNLVRRACTSWSLLISWYERIDRFVRPCPQASKSAPAVERGELSGGWSVISFSAGNHEVVNRTGLTIA